MIIDHAAVISPRPRSRAMRRRGLTQFFPAIDLALFVAVDAVLPVNVARVLGAGLAAVEYPFELDFGEGRHAYVSRQTVPGYWLYSPRQSAADGGV